MSDVNRMIGQLLRDERGVVALEYGLICATIGVVIATSLHGVSTGLVNTFNTLSQALAR
jgi:Flp pilus assembly pilin Flp